VFFFLNTVYFNLDHATNAPQQLFATPKRHYIHEVLFEYLKHD